MTSDFPYYLALFGLTFFLTVICCCVKLIDIIDRPTPRANNMPSWNYANYLQNSPVAILNPHPDPFLRYSMLGENQGGYSGEEYLTATTHTTQPGLYPSTSRSAIFSQAQQIRAAAAAAAAAAAPAAAATASGTRGSSIGSEGSNNDGEESPASSSITGGVGVGLERGGSFSRHHPLHHHHSNSGVPPPPGPPTSSAPNQGSTTPTTLPRNNPILYSIHVPEERTRCVRHGGGGAEGELPPKYEEVCFDV